MPNHTQADGLPYTAKTCTKSPERPGSLGAAGAGAPYQQYPNHRICSVLTACVASRETSVPTQRSCARSRASHVSGGRAAEVKVRRLKMCPQRHPSPRPPGPLADTASHSLALSIQFCPYAPRLVALHPPEAGSYIDMSSVGLPAGRRRRRCAAPCVHPAAAAAAAAAGLIHRSSGSAACRRASALSWAQPVQAGVAHGLSWLAP